jgi:hypothetical protein
VAGSPGLALVEGLRECLIADQSVTRFTSLSKKLP